jgi:acyl carrier protein
MDESDVLKIISSEICSDKLEMETEGQWDSLDHVKVLMALDDATGNKLKDIRELEHAMTPKRIIDILKENRIIE